MTAASDVVICHPVRTPVGRMGGGLAALSAAERLSALPAVRTKVDPESTVTAGHSSGQSDGAAMCLVTNRAAADKRGRTPRLALRSLAVTGFVPETMGIGPVSASAAALEEHFRVVRYDTRGHGETPVAAGPYTIDDLADDPATAAKPSRSASPRGFASPRFSSSPRQHIWHAEQPATITPVLVDHLEQT